jgi:hypothetical protein
LPSGAVSTDIPSERVVTLARSGPAPADGDAFDDTTFDAGLTLLLDEVPVPPPTLCDERAPGVAWTLAESGWARTLEGTPVLASWKRALPAASDA